MKIMKKMTALLAVGTMLLTWGTGVLPESVREKFAIEVTAADEYTEGRYGVLTYRNYGDYVVITDCDQSATTVEIPEEIENVEVTIIGDYSFNECEDLTSVSIPAGVNIIGNYAFCDCYNLLSINIPDSVTFIGDWAFEDCNYITSFIIPENVSYIGDYAFSDCFNLISVNVPNNISCIGDWVFEDCNNLTSIIIPESVTSIGEYAFSDCISLDSVYLSSSVAEIEYNGFEECSSLTHIYYTGTEEEWNAIIINGGNECLTNATIHFNSKMPGTETKIVASGECGAEGDNLTWTLDSEGTLTISGEGRMADWDYSIDVPWYDYQLDIVDVIIDSDVTSIGDHAFYDCDSLISITIHDSVISIGACAFQQCDSLSLITIPDSVTSIGDAAFNLCPNLTSITIPDSVTSIGDAAFYQCVNLDEIEVDINNDKYTSETGVLFNKDKTILIQYPIGKETEGYVIPDSVTSIGYRALGVLQLNLNHNS